MRKKTGPLKRCEQCGCEYKAWRERQRFCSKACQHASTRRGVVCFCKICGGEFTKTLTEIENGRGKFCSRKCYGIWQSENQRGENARFWKGGQVEVICESCGVSFSVDPGRADVARFCSHVCRGVGLKNGEYVKCEICGKEIYATSSAERRFCSRECCNQGLSGEASHRWTGGPKTATCAQCGATFSVYQHRIERGEGHFCSTTCSNRANVRQGDEHHNWRGGISFDPYPVAFTEAFKKKVRNRDLEQCAICRLPGKDIHHMDYDKGNTTKENCITLCHSCHSTTNYNRPYWQAALSNLMQARTIGL